MARKKSTKKSSPTIHSRFSDGYDSVKAKLNENSEKLRQLQSRAHDKMSENPMQSAAVAFGIGVVVGVGLKLLIDNKRR